MSDLDVLLIGIGIGFSGGTLAVGLVVKRMTKQFDRAGAEFTRVVQAIKPEK